MSVHTGRSWLQKIAAACAAAAMPRLEPAVPYPPITNRKSLRAARAIIRSKKS